MLSLSLNSSTSATFDDSRAIKVLVVPIGENSEYDAQFQAIASSVREIQINDLVKPSEWDAQVSASFQNFSWYKGNFKFDYLRYDRVPNGPGDLDNFLSSRRVLMIMGIINYPELGANPAEKIQQELDYFTRRHPYVVLRRLFLFNYAFPETPITSTSDASVGPMDVYEELVSPQLRSSRTSTSIYNNTSALEIDGQKDPNLLVVFPPNLMCGHGGEGGYVNDDDNGPIHKHPSSEALGGEGAVSMVDVHLQVNMENSACKLIASFADQMRVCDTALAQVSTLYNTPLISSISRWRLRYYYPNNGCDGRTNRTDSLLAFHLIITLYMLTTNHYSLSLSLSHPTNQPTGYITRSDRSDPFVNVL